MTEPENGSENLSSSFQISNVGIKHCLLLQYIVIASDTFKSHQIDLWKALGPNDPNNRTRFWQ